MGFGRFVCVALPFGLTLASLICLLIAMLSGVANHNIDMFEVKTKNLSISSSDLKNFVNAVDLKRSVPLTEARSAPGDLINAGLNGVTGTTVNFTATDLGLADSYRVFMWNYCSTTGTNTTCSKAKFNWAHSSINITEINARARATSGMNATLPKDITNALKTYSTVAKWTQVVYIIAFILTVSELVVGLFGFWSRLGSCVTYLVAGIASTAIIVASILATASSAVVVGAVQSTSKAYGVKAYLETSFLSITWLAAAFSIGAGLFWLFSICCCKAEHRNNKKNKGEKFVPTGSYQPLHDLNQHGANTAYQGQTHGIYNPQQPVKGAGYEPYSHTAV